MRKNFNLIGKKIAIASLSFALFFSGIPSYTTTTATTKAAALAATSSTASKELEDIFTTIDLMDATVTELTKAMGNGELTAKQLVQMYIDRINAYDDSLDLNSIISINPNALKEAEELDKERAAGTVKGDLHGVPVIVKDNYDVEGMATTAGCLSLADSIAPDDSFAVKQLKDEGAIILAKANMSEFASSGSNSRSTIGGTVHNAYDTERTAAGSSGGTAVAITANFAAAGFGTDTGSSIRRPSSFSNLYGIRPSKGLTSIDGVVPLLAARDVTGPICRSAEDMALMLETIAGTDEKDSYTVDSDADALKGSGYTASLSADGLKGKKIGFLQNSFGYNVDGTGAALDRDSAVALDSKVSGMVTQTRATLKKAGAKIINLDNLIPESLYTELRNVSYLSTGEYDMNKYFTELGDSAPFKTVKELIETGYGVGYSNLYGGTASSFAEMENPFESDAYKTMWSGMTHFRTEISKILKDNGIDAVMYVSQTDVCDLEATSSNHNNGASYMNNFGPVAGLPDMMIPMGMSETDPANGYEHELPLGMSMFSSYGNEKALMEIAYAYEQQAGDSVREQPYTTPALEDENVNAFLDELMDKVYSIDYDAYSVYPEAKIKKMEKKYDAAALVDTEDVYATYTATKALASAYDTVVAALAGNEKATTPAVTTAPTVAVAPVTTPAKATVSKVKRTSKVKASVTVKKVSDATGYKVQYSTSKKFTAKTTVTKNSTKTTLTLFKLKAKKVYYVRVRVYKTVSGKTYNGSWSAVKKIAVKK